jgi:tetratricopeptide (TPR) repeat protein
MIEAENFVKDKKFTEAEARFVEVVKLNPRHVGAYRGSGETYAELKQWAQAKETMNFLIKTVAKTGCAHARAAEARQFDLKGIQCSATQAEHAEMARDYLVLGGVCQEMQDFRSMQRSFESALLFEPNNPKYLDLFLEACILVGDRENGLRSFEKLKEANPENQKLQSIYERLMAVPVKPVNK